MQSHADLHVFLFCLVLFSSNILMIFASKFLFLQSGS